MAIGRIFAIAFDLTLVAGLLSGIKKNTGLQPNIALVEQPEIEKYLNKYLEYGDFVFDKSVSIMGQTSYFTKKP